MPTRLRIALLGTALLVFLVLGLEGLLRWFGVDLYPRSSVLQYQEVYTPALRADSAPDGTALLHTWDPRHPWQAVRVDRGSSTLRVYCFGGSATAGLGFSPNVTFVRQLEDLLRAGYPDRDVEVVNFGTVAIAAKQVRMLVEDTLESSPPDAIVVWSGNNEFLAVHAQKYADRHQSRVTQLTDRLADSYLFRAARRLVRGRPSPADLPRNSLAADESDRLTQSRIIRDVTVSELEQRDTIAAYRVELEGIVESARRRSVPVLLCGVAINVEWVGRQGLPEGWLDSVGGVSTTPEGALKQLDLTLQRTDLSALDRWRSLTRRATVKDMLGDVAGATTDWCVSAEVDPHQRRATDAVRAAIAAAAASGAAGYLDGVALLRGDDPRGRVGFAHFYDYAHFTPRGAVVIAAGIYDALQQLDGFQPASEPLARDGGGLPSVLVERLASIDERSIDFFDDREFLGIGFDRDRLASTDLWKYDEARQEFDDLLAADDTDWRAYTFRGNARGYLTTPGAAAGAVRDWRRALERCNDPDAKRAIETNLQQLTSLRIVND